MTSRAVCLTSFVALCLAPFCVGIAACGNRADPSAPAAPSSAGASTLEPPAAPASDTVGAPSAEPEPARKKRPLEIKNTCADVVTVVFGEAPKAADAGRRQVAGDSSIDGPRDAHGNLTVWLLDAKGEPLVKVHVTRGMKRVEVGRSCRTLDAR